MSTKSLRSTVIHRVIRIIKRCDLYSSCSVQFVRSRRARVGIFGGTQALLRPRVVISFRVSAFPAPGSGPCECNDKLGNWKWSRRHRIKDHIWIVPRSLDALSRERPSSIADIYWPRWNMHLGIARAKVVSFVLEPIQSTWIKRNSSVHCVGNSWVLREIFMRK